MKVVKRASEIADLVFVIGHQGGRRTQAEQGDLVARGFSKTRNSNHLTGRSLDLLPIINGSAQPNASPEDFKRIERAMKIASSELGIPVEWGSDWKNAWDKAHWELPRDYWPHQTRRGLPRPLHGAYGWSEPNQARREQPQLTRSSQLPEGSSEEPLRILQRGRLDDLNVVRQSSTVRRISHGR